MWNWFRTTLIVVCVAGTPATAQTAYQLEGQWRYRTAVWTDGECVITGQASLVRDESAPNRYTAQIVSTEACADGESTTVPQACSVEQQQELVFVLCRVLDPDGAPFYQPDNFMLRMETRDHLVGRLTANWNAPAEWRRANAALIS